MEKNNTLCEQWSVSSECLHFVDVDEWGHHIHSLGQMCASMLNFYTCSTKQKVARQALLPTDSSPLALYILSYRLRDPCHEWVRTCLGIPQICPKDFVVNSHWLLTLFSIQIAWAVPFLRSCNARFHFNRDVFLIQLAWAAMLNFTNWAKRTSQMFMHPLFISDCVIHAMKYGTKSAFWL